MKAMKNGARWLAIGCVLGGIVTSWLAPKAIAWYFTPPIEMALNCKAPIEWALHKLQMAQLFGTLAGGIVFFMLGLTVFKEKNSELMSLDDN
jgi:hypothetical protein